MKTRIALKAIKWFFKKNPNTTTLIVVPTLYLKGQWEGLLKEWELKEVKVQIINSAIKTTQVVDFLIIDEIHVTSADTFLQVFQKIDYKIILGLTATIDRLDGKEALIKRFAPVCEEVSLKECIENKWLAPFREYKILLDVDLAEYKTLTEEFIGHFSFFNYDFNLAMSMLGNIINRRKYAKDNHLTSKEVDVHAFGFNRAMQGRKSFIFNHPYKALIAQEILAFRLNSKAITFSQSIEMAQAIGGPVVHSKLPAKKRTAIEKEFNEAKDGVLNSIRTIELGADIEGVNLAIILCGTSSAIQKYQRVKA